MTRLDREDLRERFEDWLRRIDQMHHGAHHRANPEATLHRPSKPMAQWRVGLLTTAGAYVEGQEPFDVEDVHGDPTMRVIDDDVDLRTIRFAHSHYDTDRAAEDPNVVLPIEPLHTLVADGVIGSSSPVHVGMMGFNPDPIRIIESTAQDVVDTFANAGVDAVVLSPG
jgi:D-proline reductase (dithiol) PrdB